MFPPLAPNYLGGLGLVLLALFALLELEILEVAYHKLGISHRAILTLLLASLLGSYLNIPIYSVSAGPLVQDQIVMAHGIPYVVPHVLHAGKTVIAVNVGGAVIPTLLSLYLLYRIGGVVQSLIAIVVVSIGVHLIARPVPGVGIAVSTNIPGALAAVCAWILDRRRTAVVAYVSGTMGCLLGADIFNLGIVSELHAPVASIGGAGTFDGVFLSGIIAVLLA